MGDVSAAARAQSGLRTNPRRSTRLCWVALRTQAERPCRPGFHRGLWCRHRQPATLSQRHTAHTATATPPPPHRQPLPTLDGFPRLKTRRCVALLPSYHPCLQAMRRIVA